MSSCPDTDIDPHFLWSINGQYLTHFYRDFSYSSVIHFTKNLSTVESFG